MNYTSQLSLLFIVGMLLITPSSYARRRPHRSKTDRVTIEKPVGKEIEIELKENRSAGYRWHVVRKPDPQIVKLKEADYDRPIPIFRPGEMGEKQWEFEGLTPGKTTFAIEYRGPNGKIADIGPDSGTPRRQYIIIIRDRFEENNNSYPNRRYQESTNSPY